MNHRPSHRVRRAAALAPALVLATTAILAQTVYAGGNSCFRPTLEIFTQQSPGTESTTGKASVKLQFKKPFAIEAAAQAQGFADMDSGAVGSLGTGATSRFWTPTCEDWSYGWSATGSIVGSIKSRTGAASLGSATAHCSFAGNAAGDLNPPAHDSKTTQSSTTSGSSITMNVGAGSNGPSYGLGMSMGTATVTPSTNSAGDANSLFDGPKSNCGAGAETLVVVNLYAYVNAQANGNLGSWASHISKSSASSGGFVGAAVIQTLYAVSPAGVSYGMAVYPQTSVWRVVSRTGSTAPWVPGPWQPPFGQIFRDEGPEENDVPEPPMPPNPEGRTANGDEPGSPPMHKY